MHPILKRQSEIHGLNIVLDVYYNNVKFHVLFSIVLGISSINLGVKIVPKYDIQFYDWSVYLPR